MSLVSRLRNHALTLMTCEQVMKRNERMERTYKSRLPAQPAPPKPRQPAATASPRRRARAHNVGDRPRVLAIKSPDDENAGSRTLSGPHSLSSSLEAAAALEETRAYADDFEPESPAAPLTATDSAAAVASGEVAAAAATATDLSAGMLPV